MFTEEIA